MVATLPGGDYVLPAGLHPMLLVILRGSIVVRHDLLPPSLPRVALCGGTRGIRHGAATPGTRILCVAVKPGKLVELLGVPAVEAMEDVIPLASLLNGDSRDDLDRFIERLDHATAISEAGQLLYDLLLRLRARATRPRTGLVVPESWLHLPMATLADRFGLGPRQFERRFIQDYGQPLRSFRQQARCSQMVMSFVSGRSGVENWAGVAADTGYCDQAHLSRDLVRFTGYTPGILARRLAAGDPALWPYRFAPQVMTELFGPCGF